MVKISYGKYWSNICVLRIKVKCAFWINAQYARSKACKPSSGCIEKKKVDLLHSYTRSSSSALATYTQKLRSCFAEYLFCILGKLHTNLWITLLVLRYIQTTNII